MRCNEVCFHEIGVLLEYVAQSDEAANVLLVKAGRDRSTTFLDLCQMAEAADFVQIQLPVASWSRCPI